MKMPIVVFGAGGHAKVVVDVLEAMGRYEILGLFDDSAELKGTVRAKYTVIGSKADLLMMRKDRVQGLIIALGDNHRRRIVYDEAELMGFNFISAIHPSAQIGGGVRIGGGTLLVAGTVVNVDVDIGCNVIVNTGATVDHDCRIDAHVHLSPGVHLAGRVTVGEGTHIGIGAVVLPNITIGRYCVVGAGSVVREDLPDGVVAVGAPARIIRQNEVAFGL
jgi:sugar O-acyltransferase (sialic acid O-acetyltransferase NeuD family)